MSLNILNIVELGSKGVVDINDNDLPVSLLLVEKGHDTEDLDLLHLTGVADKLTNLANIERIVVTLGLGLGVDGIGVLPGLKRAMLAINGEHVWTYKSYLGEGTIVPQVALVGEAVADISKLALLDVLLDGVEELLLGDLRGEIVSRVSQGKNKGGGGAESNNSNYLIPSLQRVQKCISYLELGIGPSRNLNNHVQDGLLLVGIERDVVEGRDGDAILLDVDAVLESVGSRNLADAVSGSHVDFLGRVRTRGS